MKKFISFVLCLIMLIGILVLLEPIELKAAELKPEGSTSYDNYNHYYVRCLSSRELNTSPNYYAGYYYDNDFLIDKKLAGVLYQYDDSCEIRLYLYDDTTIYIAGEEHNFAYVDTYSDIVLNRYSHAIRGFYYYYGDKNYEFGKINNENEQDDSFGAVMSWVTKDLNESGFIETNIPYFSSESDCLSYIAGELDVKSALNYASDISDIKYDLEVPQNMKLSKKESIFDLPSYTMVWEQTDENYKNWTTEVYIYVSMDAWEGALGIHLWGDSYTYDDLFLMADSFSTYKLKYVIDTDSKKYEKAAERIDEYIFNDNPKLTGTATDYYKIYMRNAYYDGSYRHYSNWVLVEFDYEFESGQGVTSIIEMGGSVNDTPGVSKPSQDIVGDVVTDSQYDGTIDGNLVQTDTDILGWIQSGFGIGGDNGVLAMIGETFDFIPSEVWAVMMAGISLMVAVAVFKFIRG